MDRGNGDMGMVGRVHSFLKENNISTMSELRGLVSSSQKQLWNVRDDLKSCENRIAAIDERVQEIRVYREHRDIHAQYTQLKPRKQAKFYETHRAELMLFDAARRSLTRNHVDPAAHLDALREERERLAAQRGKLHREYTALNNRVWDMECVRRDAERIARGVTEPEWVIQDQRRNNRDEGLER
jgi:chromosome segregation ATPase